MATPLLPKATAMWLLENTTLTFKQIGAFCGLHELEIQTLADAETLTSMRPLDPIANHQLTEAEIKRCETDPASTLKLLTTNLPKPKSRTKGPRYTPLNKRSEKPDAIAWIVKNHPEVSDAQISKVIGTTKPTIGKIRDKSHWNIQNIKPRHPVELGLCSSFELDQIVKKAQSKLPPSAAIVEEQEGIIETLS